jgi:hypothetical protein
MAKCPAHEDRYPSLQVGGDDRKWIGLYCHAGCSYKQVLEALGLTWRDVLLEEDPNWKPARPKLRAREVELECMFASDRLLADEKALAWLNEHRGWSKEALRALRVGYDEKKLTLPVYDKDLRFHDVLLYSPAGGPRKVKAGYKKGRTLWPAPEHVPTPEGEAGSLYVVEGEGTAISMWSVGLAAVALPGGISKQKSVMRPGSFAGAGWHPSWTPRFLKRFPKIVLVPDCDESGRRLMYVAENDLRRQGAYCYSMDIAPHRADGYDIGDMLRLATTPALRRQARRFVVDLTRESRPSYRKYVTEHGFPSYSMLPGESPEALQVSPPPAV